MAGFNRSTPGTLAEINVTPLVDVMLVLLIVFMISAPLMQQGLQVDLPKANTGNLNQAPEQLVLSINKAHHLFLDSRAVAPGTLAEQLKQKAHASPKVEVVIQADQTLAYGFVTEVIAEVKRAGIQKVGLATDPGESRRAL